MNWEAIGAVGEIVGAVAVVLTLVYLAAQIRQNTQSNRTVAIQTINNQNGDWLSILSQNDSMARLFRKGSANFDSLNEDEQTQYIALMMQFGRIYDTQYHLHLMGTVPEELWQSAYRTLTWGVTTEGGRAWWRLSSRLFSDSFRTLVNRIIDNPDSDGDAGHR